MIERGADAARASGHPRPTTAECIHRGLLEAARLNPLPIGTDKVPLLVRSALFEVEPREECNPQFVDIVTERLLTAVHGHLEEDSAAFEKWFLGSKNSLVHQLSKQTKSPGGPLEESEVRKVLLQLGWQSYSYAGNCIHAQMRLFQNAIPDPLNERERLLFEHMHQRQPYLGNLPRVLLLPRFGFLQGVLWELWDRLPDLSLVPVLHRLLDYYGVLACRRREADRRIKNGRPIRFVEAAYEPPEQDERFQTIAAAIRERRAIDCQCSRREWRAELTGRPRKTIRIVHRCLNCDYQAEMVLSREEFTSIGQSVL